MRTRANSRCDVCGNHVLWNRLRFGAWVGHMNASCFKPVIGKYILVGGDRFILSLVSVLCDDKLGSLEGNGSLRVWLIRFNCDADTLEGSFGKLGRGSLGF